MPVPVVCGVGPGLGGVCAFTQTSTARDQKRTAAKRNMVFDIDLKTFQQGTLGPGEMLKIRVAEETPGAKNCGVTVKIASKT